MTFYDPRFPIHVPSTSSTSLGVGLNALTDDTTGANNLAIGYNAGSAITTGANNISILTGNATDPATAATANTLTISGGSTAVMSATAINTTPIVTIPGSLVVTGAQTTGAINGLTVTASAGSTLTITAGETVAITDSITLTGTDAQTYTFPTTSATIARTDAANTFTGVQTMVAPNITGTVAGAGFTAAALVVTSLNGNTITSGTGTLTLAAGITATGPATSGTMALIAPPPVAVGTSLAITAAMSGAPILLNTAGGSTATLPAATGTGNKYKFLVSVSTTSAAHKILTVGTDYIIGVAMGYTGSTAKVFGSPAATNRSIQMPNSGSQPSGGIIGDYFEFTDVGAALWAVRSMYQAGTTPTTPFSSSTS